MKCFSLIFICLVVVASLSGCRALETPSLPPESTSPMDTVTDTDTPPPPTTDTDTPGATDDSSEDVDTADEPEDTGVDCDDRDISEPCDYFAVACTSECYPCVMSEAIPDPCWGSNSNELHDPCTADTDCAAIRACVMDNCSDHDQDWDTHRACINDCRSGHGETGTAIFDTLDNGILCDACSFSCQGMVDSCPPEVCDSPGVDCYTECWGCAMNTTCRDAVKACEASADCVGLQVCRNDNCYAQGLTVDEQTACIAGCDAQWPDGVALLHEYHRCVICDGCPLSCAGELPGICD